MPVTSYGPWPTAEEQPYPPLVPRYFHGPAAGGPVVGTPTDHYAPAAGPADHYAPAAGPADHLAWPDEAGESDTAELSAVTDTADEQPAPPPVFVDASGRRQRRIRRLGAVLAVPAGGYLALLGSTLLGGPTVNAPFLPLPQPPAPSAPAQASTPSTAPFAAPEAAAPPGAPPTVAARQAGTGPVGDRHPQTAGAPTGPAAGLPSAPAGVGSPAPVTSPAAPPNSPPAATPPPGHGRPTSPPGNSGNKPGKP
ncbi:MULTISPECIES: hypothetical protein [unclassified Kitasatospora]|uniref:hypothetical protein n=1 Tax=unclassified Kitasatospora TaxID=2633591 RepID=UPI0033FF8C6D